MFPNCFATTSSNINSSVRIFSVVLLEPTFHKAKFNSRELPVKSAMEWIEKVVGSGAKSFMEIM